MSEHKSEFDGRPELVKRRARAIIFTRIVVSLVVLFALSCLGLLTYNAITGLATRNTIIDCTDPSGDCYQEGQERTGEFINQLIKSNQLDEVATRRIVVIAVACADDPHNETIAEIQRCVDSQVKEDRQHE